MNCPGGVTRHSTCWETEITSLTQRAQRIRPKAEILRFLIQRSSLPCLVGRNTRRFQEVHTVSLYGLGRDGTPGSLLDICFHPFEHLPCEIGKLSKLRYLALASFSVLPPSVRNLRCLRTLIRYSHQASIFLAAEIWVIKQLRHLYFRKCFYFPNVQPEQENYLLKLSRSNLALTKLQDRYNQGECSCSSVALTNLKKLGIRESEEECLTAEQMSGKLKKLVLLEHLETFKGFFIKPWILKQCDVFPPTLKKLTLRGCQLPWDLMTILCKLPKLEVLKLKDYAFQGSEWEPTDERFQQLKFLLLDGTDLIHWKASSFQFPKLESLF
ncbi:hypothetical protein P3L10_027640 [Capsicum annuum]